MEEGDPRYHMHLDEGDDGATHKITQAIWITENFIQEREYLDWQGSSVLHEFVAFVEDPYPVWFVLHTGDNEVDLLLRDNYE